MKEFIEKLIGRLEELKASGNPYDSYWDEAMYRATELVNSTSNKTIDGVIEIVNQLAEEYKEQNIDQDLMIVASLPSLYPMMQPFEVKAIDRVVSSAKHSGGWIPCSKRLPETHENVLICQSDGYVNVGWYSLNEFKDMNSISYKDVIAWQPLPDPYIPKQEEQKG